MVDTPETYAPAPPGMEWWHNDDTARWELRRDLGYEQQTATSIADQWFVEASTEDRTRWLTAVVASVLGHPLQVACGSGCGFEVVYWPHIECGVSPQPPEVCPSCGGELAVG